jgi:hypothetical protein
MFGFQLREHPSGSDPPSKEHFSVDFPVSKSLPSPSNFRRESGPAVVPHLDTAFEHKVPTRLVLA